MNTKTIEATNKKAANQNASGISSLSTKDGFSRRDTLNSCYQSPLAPYRDSQLGSLRQHQLAYIQSNSLTRSIGKP